MSILRLVKLEWLLNRYSIEYPMILTSTTNWVFNEDDRYIIPIKKIIKSNTLFDNNNYKFTTSSTVV